MPEDSEGVRPKGRELPGSQWARTGGDPSEGFTSGRGDDVLAISLAYDHDQGTSGTRIVAFMQIHGDIVPLVYPDRRIAQQFDQCFGSPCFHQPSILVW